MHVLVIGGTGFLGSAISRILIKNSHVVDILSRGRTDHPVEGVDSIYHLDRYDQSGLCKTFSGIHYDAVVDVCAYSGNAVKTTIHAISTSRYLLCSTCEVYDFLYDNTVHDTDHPLVDYYSARKYVQGKLDAEREVVESGKSYCIIRPSYIYGSGNTLKREDKVFSAIIKSLPIKMEKLSTVMNLIHVRDLARIFVNQVSCNTDSIINASNPDRIDYRQYLRVCEEICGVRAIVISDNDYNDISHEVAFPYLNRSILIDPYPRDSNCIDEMCSFSDGMRECFLSYIHNNY